VDRRRHIDIIREFTCRASLHNARWSAKGYRCLSAKSEDSPHKGFHGARTDKRYTQEAKSNRGPEPEILFDLEN